MPDEDANTTTGPQHESQALLGSGEFEKRADVFPVMQVEPEPIDSIMNAPGPLIEDPPQGDQSSPGPDSQNQ